MSIDDRLLHPYAHNDNRKPPELESYDPPSYRLPFLGSEGGRDPTKAAIMYHRQRGDTDLLYSIGRALIKTMKKQLRD